MTDLIGLSKDYVLSIFKEYVITDVKGLLAVLGKDHEEAVADNNMLTISIIEQSYNALIKGKTLDEIRKEVGADDL